MTVAAFRDWMLLHGLEPLTRGKGRKAQLRIWPFDAYPRCFTPAQREWWDTHQAEMLELVSSAPIETTVHWDGRTLPALPDPAPEPSAPESAPQPPRDPLYCRNCNRSPCIGPDAPAFEVLHPDDAEVINRTAKSLVNEMFASLFRSQR
jgi:hypothetical protein